MTATVIARVALEPVNTDTRKIPCIISFVPKLPWPFVTVQGASITIQPEFKAKGMDEVAHWLDAIRIQLWIRDELAGARSIESVP